MSLPSNSTGYHPLDFFLSPAAAGNSSLCSISFAAQLIPTWSAMIFHSRIEGMERGKVVAE
jgi:hypothetical protein